MKCLLSGAYTATSGAINITMLPDGKELVTFSKISASGYGLRPLRRGFPVNRGWAGRSAAPPRRHPQARSELVKKERCYRLSAFARQKRDASVGDAVIASRRSAAPMSAESFVKLARLMRAQWSTPLTYRLTYRLSQL